MKALFQSNFSGAGDACQKHNSWHFESRFDIWSVQAGKNPIQLSIREFREATERFGSSDYAAADGFGDLLGKQEQLLLVSSKFDGQQMKQLFRWAVPIFEFVVLDFR